jgi:hypothetical protein
MAFRNASCPPSFIMNLVRRAPTDIFTIYDLNQYLKRKATNKSKNVVPKEFLNKHIKDQVLKEAITV